MITVPEHGNYREFVGWSIEGEELRQRALDKKICAWCGNPFTNNRVKYWCSESEGNNCSQLFAEKHYFYWDKYRVLSLERDNYTCWICKQRAKEVHHIIPIEDGGDVFDLDNLMSLCVKCHKLMRKNINMIMVIPEHYIRNKAITDYIQVES